MIMVTKMESSQWRAVAVPWAWNARRMGCDVDRRGGSVVLRDGHLAWHGLGRVCTTWMGWMGDAGYYSPTQRIEEIPDHSGSRGLAKGMPGLEVDDGEASLSCGRVRGASAPFIGRGWGAERESRTETRKD